MSPNLPHVYDLTGKTALITGGAGLLGREYAAALLENGARTVITDLDIKVANSVAENLAKGYDKKQILVRKMDVTDLKQILEVFNDLKSQGGVDILINNAAFDPKVKKETAADLFRLEKFSLEEWDYQIKVGLTGAYLCARVFGSEMAKKKGGGNFKYCFRFSYYRSRSANLY